MNPTEQYRMNTFLVPGFLALIILFAGVIPVTADNGPVNLSFSSASEEGGFITADVIATPLIKSGIPGGYLTFWLNPSPGDCSTSRLLSWQYLPPGNETANIRMKAPVPYGIIPVTYEIMVHYGSGNQVPAACDTGPADRTTLVISTPGQGSHDMAATLPGAEGKSSGPDYRLDSISGIDTTVRQTPSSSLTPTVTITNGGSDDTTGQPVEVHAYLGSEELIPVTATIEAMKAGESRTASLSYTIPGTIPQRSFPFFMIIDPRGVHGTADAATNLKRTGGQMTVHIVEKDLDCGCK